jgi:ATP-dependent helicase/DNAse subunit B
MRLIVGPAGSGKTTLVLNQLRDAARMGGAGARLLVPTATLRRHLQNQLAREGCVLRADTVQTLSDFVQPFFGTTAQAPDSVVYLAVEEAVRRLDRAEFRPVALTPGFCASLARSIAEFSSAGCDSKRLRASLPEAELAAPFLAIYKDVETTLERRDLALRARCLQLAAARIAAEGLGGIRAIWLDGFHALSDPELEVVSALAHAWPAWVSSNNSCRASARLRWSPWCARLARNAKPTRSRAASWCRPPPAARCAKSA